MQFDAVLEIPSLTQISGQGVSMDLERFAASTATPDLDLLDQEIGTAPLAIRYGLASHLN
jgi:hypothetical protein